MNIFELKEGRTYQVHGQYRKFRVSKGQLENDGPVVLLPVTGLL